MFFQTKKLPVIILRPGNAYGPGQKPFSGQGFVATAVASILSQKDVTIFGKTGAIRDYVYVDDLAIGILRTLNRGKVGEIYNLGSGVGNSNLEIVNHLKPLAKSNGLTLTIKNLPRRPFDVRINILDSAKIKQDTGWQPVTSLSQGLKQTWDWFVANPKYQSSE